MDGFEELLQAWGDARVCRREGVSPGGGHALDRARAFAPVTRERFLASVIGRDGTSRRAFMAQQSGAGMRITPMWAVDPVPCTASRSGPRRDYSGGLPDHLRPIDAAVRELAPLDPKAADCLIAQYTGQGTQEDKAARLGLTVRQYRTALYRGRDVLRRKLLPAPLTAAVTLR